jgi:hypothetical protein
MARTSNNVADRAINRPTEFQADEKLKTHLVSRVNCEAVPADNDAKEEDIVGFCYQATPGEAIENLARAIANCKVCELAIKL